MGYNGEVGWSLVEEFFETKMRDRVCEDLILVTGGHAVVIDGASDATGVDFGGRSGGRFAAETIRLAFQGMDPHATARQAVDDLSKQLAQAVGDLPALVRWPASVRWPAATVVCLSFSGHARRERNTPETSTRPRPCSHWRALGWRQTPLRGSELRGRPRLSTAALR